MSILELVAASLAMGVGAFVQAAVGFGSNLLAAPVLVLIDPVLVPGPITLASLGLNLAVAARETAEHDRRVRLAVAGLVPGTVAAGLALAALSADNLAVVIGVLVLAAVAMVASGYEARPTAATLVGTGAVSGFMGTVSGIGGPPIALVYARSPGPVLRATLSRYFLASGLIAAVVLAVVGRLGPAELSYAAALAPGTFAGFAASGWLARHLDRRTARPLVLALSALAGLAVVARELW